MDGTWKLGSCCECQAYSKPLADSGTSLQKGQKSKLRLLLRYLLVAPCLRPLDSNTASLIALSIGDTGTLLHTEVPVHAERIGLS
jgi:hypothetical protein